MPIFWVFKTDVFVVEKGLFARKNIFDDLFSGSMTWEYRGLEEVTGGYKGLQGVTRGYRGLQGVTGGDKGLQRIIETFSQLERSQIFFLGLFCIKIKVEEISNFLPKRWTNPFGKILILRFS